VSPFYEDNLAELRSMLGADRLLFGSDWPHAEGLSDPLSYVDDLDDAGFEQSDVEKVMYANTASLVQPA
jgi:predicted TIM-barrel fold metal-dependent hydrolase